MAMGSMWDSTPRGLRAIADLKAIIKPAAVRIEAQNPVALVIGAGVDSSLRGRPLWAELIYDLARKCGIDENWADALKSTAKRWPVEAAEALRCTAGSAQFSEQVREFVKSDARMSGTTMGTALVRLVEADIKVIINFNYTQDLIDVIDNPLIYQQKSIRIIDRSYLASWNQYQLLFPPPNTVHIIYIHGFVDPHGTDEPNIVLDHKSYDEVSLGTSHYRRLLSRLFHDFTVITVGTSWSDVSLRNAAAEVHFEYPIASRTHFALLSHGDPIEDLWQERGLISSYSVRSLYYSVHESNNHDEAGNLLIEVTKPLDLGKISAIPTKHDLINIAERLDSWGDYEAGAQSAWMVENWRVIKGALEDDWKDNLNHELWLSLAKIERHLRHYLWFYLPHGERAKTRKAIWENIASLWLSLPKADQDSIWDYDKLTTGKSVPNANERLEYEIRGLFEFALGVYEVQYEDEAGQLLTQAAQSWRAKLESLRSNAPDTYCGQRIAVAQRVWLQSVYESDEALQEVRNSASRCAWESIEAKVALDQLQKQFKELVEKHKMEYKNEAIKMIPRAWSDEARRKIVLLSDDARAIARSAGCFRREVGAVVLESFVVPLQSAERNLIAIFKRFTENGGREKELLTIWYIYIGLLAVFCEKRGGKSFTGEEGLRWLTQLCGPPNKLRRDEFNAITLNSIPHWGAYHSKAAELALDIANLIRNG